MHTLLIFSFLRTISNSKKFINDPIIQNILSNTFSKIELDIFTNIY